MTVVSPPALLRFWRELRAAAPDADDMIMSGIAANKSGYHNSRENHLDDRPNDYSIQLAVDKLGDPEHASAIDITFKSAQAGRFGTIAKYSRRLYNAYKARDPRLFYRGERVWREFFGNIDTDREVEGWSLYRGRAASSDGSHLWHIHQSPHRKFANNWDALKGALDIMLGRPIVPAPPPITEPPGDEDDMPSVEEIWGKKFLEYVDQDGNNKRDPRTVADILYLTNEAVVRLVEAQKARELAEQGRDAAQDRQLSQLNDTLAEIRTLLGTLVTAFGRVEAHIASNSEQLGQHLLNEARENAGHDAPEGGSS
jgi:hypothetical protein